MNISLIFRTISHKSFNFTLFELSFPAIFPGQVGCKSDEQCRATDVNTSCIDRICVCEEGKKAVDSVCVNGTVFTQRNEHCMIYEPQSTSPIQLHQLHGCAVNLKDVCRVLIILSFQTPHLLLQPLTRPHHRSNNAN